MSAREGPPKKVEGRTPNHRGRPSTNAISDHHDADKTEPSNTVACPGPIHAQLRARREASYRSDPWLYEPPGARGYEDAAMHLLEQGLLPAAHREGLQMMWKRGGACRQAAELIADAWGLAG